MGKMEREGLRRGVTEDGRKEGKTFAYSRLRSFSCQLSQWFKCNNKHNHSQQAHISIVKSRCWHIFLNVKH